MKSEKEIRRRIAGLRYERKVDKEESGEKFEEWYKGALSQLKWILEEE